MMTLLLDTVKVGPDAQHGREQHAPLHVAAKAGMLNTLFAFQKTSDCQSKEWHICPLGVANGILQRPACSFYLE